MAKNAYFPYLIRYKCNNLFCELLFNPVQLLFRGIIIKRSNTMHAPLFRLFLESTNMHDVVLTYHIKLKVQGTVHCLT